MKKNMYLELLEITIATIIIAAGVYFFLVPSNASVGSISGLAIILANFVPLSISAITMILNVVLLIVGFAFFGKEFGAKTVYTSLLLPVAMGVFETVYPSGASLTGDQVLDVICSMVVVDIGVSMLFVRNASSGGLDIIAKCMNKFLHMDLGKAMGLSGMAVALSSVFVSDMKTVALSVLGTYFSGVLLDHFLFGSTIKKRVCIISNKYNEVLDFILYDLHSGATKYKAYGAYTNKEHTEINTLVDKNEYLRLMNFINKVDPDAFVTVYSVQDVLYKPKPIVNKNA